MKKSILICTCLCLGAGLFAAVRPEFSQGYEFRSLGVNTPTSEGSISLLPNLEMLYLNDGKVFISAIDTAQSSLSTPQENAVLTQMGVHGTVAAVDSVIYFSLVESKNCEWLYAATFKDGKCSAPQRLVIEGMEEGRADGNFLSNAGWSYYTRVRHLLQNPAIANEGNRLYFTSSTIEGGQGGKDLWCIDKKENGTWGKPINLGPTINTASDEDFAFMDTDNLLYFSSNQTGVRHLYVAYPADGWKKVEMLERPYNSAIGDHSMVIAEGVPFVVTNRNIGHGADIYAFQKLPCEIEILDLQVVPDDLGKEYNLEGKVKFASEPLGSSLAFSFADSSDVVTAPFVSPYYFSFVGIDRPDSTMTADFKVAFNEECIAFTTYEAPAKPYVQKKREFYWVFFLYDFDKDILATNFQVELDSLAKEMKKFPDAIFEVAGYTDNRGSEAYNDRLSLRRAQDIVNLLMDAGIPADHLKAVGYGERRLQVPNAQTEEEHAQNRRVEVRILNVEESPAVVASSPETINPEEK